MKKPTEKIYCYVDETGQDTKGEFFIVSVAVTKENRDQLIRLLNEIEIETNKLATKWSKSKRKYQIAYIQRIFGNKQFKKIAYFSLIKGSISYQNTTIVAIATAINAAKTKEKYKASVFVDGLQRSEVHRVSVALRRVGLSIEKVRGITDESHSMIRLADAIAGLVRKKYKQVDYAEELYKLGIKNDIIERL